MVLPSTVETAPLLEGYTIDPDTALVGGKNMIEMISGVALGGSNAVNVARYLGTFKTYDEVVKAATLPVEIATTDTCVTDDGRRTTPGFLGRCELSSYPLSTKVSRGQDLNARPRSNAIKVAGYLTAGTFDPAALGGGAPTGTATVAGDGTKIALVSGDGRASATANEKWSIPGIAAAATSGGRDATASATGGLALALNADTDQTSLTWFGQALDLTKLKNNSLVAGLAGDELAGLDQIEDLSIPALKEVACFGLAASASAQGLGSCTNVLGTFDFYRDERPSGPGTARQTQFGLTDVTSLVLGNDALLKRAQTEEFATEALAALSSEDTRIKLAKDFVRLTQEVRTGDQLIGADGEPVVDEAGEPVYETTTVAYVTSDYGLREPLVISWLGHEIVFFPWTETEVNGAKRPNLLAVPVIRKISEDAGSGLLPKVSVVTLDLPFGLGTFDSSAPGDWFESVTLLDDLPGLSGLLGGETGGTDTGSDTGSDADSDAAPDAAVEAAAAQQSPVTVPAQDPEPQAVEPAVPAVPVTPAVPAEPVTPVEPSAPAAPAVPASPVTPSAPVAPVTPVTPSDSGDALG